MQNNDSQSMALPEEPLRPGTWAPLPGGGIIFVKHPTDAEMRELYALTKVEISPSVAPIDVVLGVYKHNRDSFQGIYLADDESGKNAHLMGYYSFLHLTQEGIDLLQKGELDTLNPDLRYLVPLGEKPASIYIWAIVARKVNRIIMPLVAKSLGAALYGGVPLYATARTIGGMSVMKGTGFDGVNDDSAELGKLYRLDVPQVDAIRAA